MTYAKAITQTPLDMEGHKKREMRTQFGALCWRVKKGETQILMVTSRNTKRWIIPKGWPSHGQTAAESAATEAWEEAGVKGKVGTQCLGVYTYAKAMPKTRLPVMVAVFPVKVRKRSKDFPERKQRRTKWMSPKKASSVVAEPELRGILRHFDPRRLV